MVNETERLYAHLVNAAADMDAAMAVAIHDTRFFAQLAQAACTGCRALTSLTTRLDYEASILKAERSISLEVREVFDNPQALDRFLAQERSLLLKAGVRPDATDFLIREVRDLVDTGREREWPPVEILPAVRRLRDESCEVCESLESRETQRRLSDEGREATRSRIRGASKVTAGVGTLGLNTVKLIVTFGLSAGSVYFGKKLIDRGFDDFSRNR